MLDYIEQNYQVELMWDNLFDILNDEKFVPMPLHGNLARMARNLDAKALPTLVGCYCQVCPVTAADIEYGLITFMAKYRKDLIEERNRMLCLLVIVLIPSGLPTFNLFFAIIEILEDPIFGHRPHKVCRGLGTCPNSIVANFAE